MSARFPAQAFDGAHSEASSQPPPPPQAPQDTPPSARWQTAGYVTLGLGTTAVGVGSYLGLRAVSKNQSSQVHCAANICDPEGAALRQEALSLATWSTASVGVGLTGVAAGIFMLTLGDDAPAPRTSSVRVILAGRELMVHGAF